MSMQLNHRLPPKGAFSSSFSLSPHSQTTERKPLSKTTSSSPLYYSERLYQPESDTNEDFNDMFQYAQLALKKSSEVQEDIAKLFNLWEVQDKEEIPKLWLFLDNILQENGFESLGDKPNLKNLTTILLDLVAELKVLRQAMSQKQSTSEDQVYLDDKFMHNRLHSFGSDKNFETSEKSVEYYQEYIHSLEEQLASAKSRLNEFHEYSIDQLNSSQKLIKKIQKTVEANDESEILGNIKSYKNIMMIIPRLEVFVEEVCKQFVPEVVKENNYETYSIALKEVFPRINSLKSSLEHLSAFKGKVYKCLKLNSDTEELDALEKIGAVVFFQKLFEVDDSEDILGVMEKLFLYYIESKKILEYIKHKLNIDPETSGSHLSNEIRKKL